ncbi:hypothetical protein WMY93_018124 [Mugilogobius chulae]|uniref:FAM21/CAPZIP domain-containing protein n=1 Tax=Mugilogobius chulae TaxID=88201 RepID=A0AAW0NHY2_9GOBI
MKQNSANWSLAADSGLFLFLQDFSQRMLSKTHEIEKQLDSLIRDTKATDSCLHSVFNDFLMLSNTQFIENRVYDEEVEESVPKADAPEKQPEQEKTREQKEAELIPKMQEAVTYGLKVLESAFEHLDIKAGNSDSEDEEVPDRVDAILEPKDLYVDRPLPYLIGSQAFMEQDDVGLGDLSSDEMSVDSDRDSVIESEDDKAAVHSDEDFNQDDDKTPEIIKKKSSMLSYDDDEEDEDSDIFGDSDKEEEEDTKSTQQASFADELAARIKGEAVSKPEADRASLSSKKKSKSRKESKPAKPQAADEDSDDMFKPPKLEYEEEEEEDLSPFGGRSGLFSGGRGLFDDDDEVGSFSDAPKPTVAEDKTQSAKTTTMPSADSTKSGKKIPAGGVSIFPENSLFGSPPDLEPVQSKENGTPAVKPALTGGGLFDDEEEDDFFTGNTVKTSAAKEKPKPKKALDLFDDEEEDGIFSVTSPAQMPAGAVSLFGPGTKSLLSEGLKKHPPSTSEEPQKTEENGIAPEVEKSSVKPKPKSQSRGLFSDDEDSQIFSSVPKSQSKPETLSQAKTKKPAVSLFDDEDEEDQWLSSKSTEKSETKSGMKSSVSAPSSLPSVKAPQKSSLFDDDDDDLFAAPKETSEKKSQRVALLFEDEDEDDKGSLFSIKPAASPAPKSSPAPSKSPVPSLNETPDVSSITTTEDIDKPPYSSKPIEETPTPKPAGAVSLFGGIDVFASTQKKSPVNKSKTKVVSLFDNDDEDEPDLNDPIFNPSKPAENTPKSTEEKPAAISTGVFQDEELLFSQTQQKDNDPDVDLFSTSGKSTIAASSKPSSTVKPAAPSLFSDDDEDDLFSSVKPKAAPKVAEKPSKPAEKPSKPVEKAPLASPEPSSESQKPAPAPAKPKDPSSRIGKLQLQLRFGASSSSGVSSSSLSPSPLTSPLELPRDTEETGVSFDTPAQVTTLQSAHKNRVKGSSQRRPQSRAARQQSAQKSVEATIDDLLKTVPEPTVSDLSLPPPEKPSALTLPVSTNNTDSSKENNTTKKTLPIPEEDDIFSSDNLFGSSVASTKPPSANLKNESSPASNDTKAKKEKSTLPSLFDDSTDDLFQKVKSKSSTKKSKPAPFLEDEDDDDLFGVSNSSSSSTTNNKDLKNNNSFSKQDLFQDEVDPVPKAQKKHKEKKIEASLFDDNVDIFADLSDTFKPKHKSKTKEAKSIFDDDMDDIFSASTVKAVAKAPPKQKKASVPPEPSVASDTVDIFDDPLNALGGN